MKNFFSRNQRLLFYGFWLLLGLMQAGLTELQDDEAYYWVYSKFLDWGYFDHPPMIGLLVKMGYAIFPNELGVRFFPLLLNGVSLLLIEKLLLNKNRHLFYTIVLSIAALQLAGFEAVPDTPLICFTAFFFLSYRRFLESSSRGNVLLLGISVALLSYTKYQALLVVFFVLLSNLKLFRKPSLYLAGGVAALLFLPHLLWQWEHNWISLRYHLFESNVNPYKFSFTGNYLLGQLLLPGPLAGIILIPAAFLYRVRTDFERGLKWTLTGIYLFFLLSSFRGEVEVNWTSPIIVPLIILAHQYLQDSVKLRQWLFRLLPVTLALVLFARIVMISDIIPVPAVKKRYHAWKDWPEEMKKRTRGLPIVFSNSYQRASKYWFYSGQVTCSQNHVRDHRNNYDLWPLEELLLGKPVFFLDIFDLKRFPDSLKTPIGSIGYRYDSACTALGRIRFVPEKRSYKVNRGRAFLLGGRVEMPVSYLDYLTHHPSLSASIKLFLFRDNRILKEVPLTLSLNQLIVKESDSILNGFAVEVDPTLAEGNYHFIISIEVPGYNPGHNSEKIGLEIE